ncbi:hypothetical protein FF124_04075 [Martelella lutilitoris]|uniref:Uncharacterized protein n=1 Tax=Martelella lutilitoris TaxID=2583532 RepID=A0A5C4JUT9_9HYPH|nr:hypothetical protein [Martelella lutilitoris]TNB49178.1 hypothetical protein FF124_04075 [Martelella lutilitoris]
MTATKDEFFKPGRLSASDKASITDRTARAILAEEATQLQSKTERLRRLRLEREAAEPDPAPKKKKTKRTA